MVAADALDARWPDAGPPPPRRCAAPPEAAAAARRRPARGLRAAGRRRSSTSAALKAVSRGIFERTFAVTVALNALTLAVAGIALLTSLLTLADARLVQLAPLWAMGVTRRAARALELGRRSALAALTALLALPLGLALAWVLTAVVNVRAFGWRLPVLLLPGQWATLFGAGARHRGAGGALAGAAAGAGAAARVAAGVRQ